MSNTLASLCRKMWLWWMIPSISECQTRWTTQYSWNAWKKHCLADTILWFATSKSETSMKTPHKSQRLSVNHRIVQFDYWVLMKFACSTHWLTSSSEPVSVNTLSGWSHSFKYNKYKMFSLWVTFNLSRAYGGRRTCVDWKQKGIDIINKKQKKHTRTVYFLLLV